MSHNLVSAAETTARVESGGQDLGPLLSETISALAVRVRGEYTEMPGLRLSVSQAARLFGVAPDLAHATLEDLRRASVLTRSYSGLYTQAS